MKLTRIVSQDFKKVMEKLSKAEVPMRTAFKLRGIIKQVNEEINKYEETRIETLKKYGQIDENGQLKVDEKNTVLFKDDNAKQEYLKELSELLILEVDLPKISISELGEKIQLTTLEVAFIEELLDSK